MTTPIADFVKSYIKSNMSRLHMPGHKGVSFLGCESYDITEINGADSLYSADGIIKESEKNAKDLFNTSLTLYSTEGSTQSINAMVFLAYLRSSQKDEYILAGRNAHKALIYALAKIDAGVKWIYPQQLKSICTCKITPSQIEEILAKAKKLPFAVYITSPDYLGSISDINGISKVCRKYGVPLLVDNAHGSYLRFCSNDMHPISLGADICCDSAHKTLPCLTGAGYLHIAKDDLYGFSANAVRGMELFGSTSPSYLILQSLDLCNDYLEKHIKTQIKNCVKNLDKIKNAMRESGIPNISDEPLKITADFSSFLIEQKDIYNHFKNFDVEPEYTDDNFAVFMITPQNTSEDIENLTQAFKSFKCELKSNKIALDIPTGKNYCSIHQAVFSECEEMDAEKCLGRISGAPTVACPPAIPIAVSGEIITEKHIELFKHYGIKRILVLK